MIWNIYLRRVFGAALMAAITLLLISPLACSQSSDPAGNNGRDSTLEPASITMFISAQNTDGTAAKLSPSDLDVKIEGKATSVREVQYLGRPALRYCLLFDFSGSQRPVMSWHKNDAVALLSLMRPGKDYGTLINFNNKPYLDAEGTEPQELERAISDDAKGGTALYDAIGACSENMAKRGIDGLRVMFILADGHDNASSISREEAVRSTVRMGIRVYAITLKSGAEPSEGVKALKHFSKETGGEVYVLKTDKDAQLALSQISGELGSVFSVAVNSPEHMSKESVNKIEIKCRKKMIVVNAPEELFEDHNNN